MLAFLVGECPHPQCQLWIGLPKLLGGYHLWQSQDDKEELCEENNR